MPVGSIWDVAEDAWDATGGRVIKTAADIGTSAIDILPGGSAVRGALNDLITGPLRDFAKSAAGRVFFTALSTSLFNATAWQWGPQIASVAFAVPGLAAGDDFVTAYLQGIAKRTEQLVQIAGNDIFGGDVATALGVFAKELGVTDKVVSAAEEIADRLGIRVDAAEYAKAIWNRAPLPDMSRFGADGRRLPPNKTSVLAAMRSKVATYYAPPKYVTSQVSKQMTSKVASFFAPAPAPRAPSYERAAAPMIQDEGVNPLVIVGGVAAVGVAGVVAWLALRK